MLIIIKIEKYIFKKQKTKKQIHSMTKSNNNNNNNNNIKKNQNIPD